MIRNTFRIAMAAALIGLGWAAGKAQTSQPDFELIVDAPPGQTNVTCARGCEMAWVERGVNPQAKPVPTFTFSCGGGAGARCPSSWIDGGVPEWCPGAPASQGPRTQDE